MSPDSPLGLLAQRVARLEQQVQDLAERVIERVEQLAQGMKESRHESTEDYKRFGPMLQDHAGLRADMGHLADQVREIRREFTLLEERMDREERERRLVREAREEKEREREMTEKRDRWARWVGAGALTLTFVSMTVGWLILAL